MRHLGWLLTLAICLSACSKHDRLPLSWKPQELKLSCPSGECPEGTGLIIFAQRQKRDFKMVHCTGTMVAGNQVLTNSHCDFVHEPGFQGYFFTMRGNETVFSPVTGDTFRVKGKTSGLERDLAVLTLGHSLPGQPRRIARKIPAKLETLIGFVANRAFENHFVLDRRVCKTIPKMPLYGGGVKDENTGLALFDCDIKKGNSGAAMFLSGLLDDIQVVVNTVWKFENGHDDTNLLQAFFFDLPSYFRVGYAMGERVHCQSIKGWNEPETNCGTVSFERTVSNPFRTAIAAELMKRQSKQTGSIVWTTEVFSVKAVDEFYNFRRPAVILAPRALCYRGGKNTPQELSFSYYRVGLHPDGHAGTKLLTEDHMSVSSTMTDTGNVKLVFVRKPVASGRDFNFKDGDRERFVALASPSAVHRLPMCGENAESEAEAIALKNLSDSLMKVSKSEAAAN